MNQNLAPAPNRRETLWGFSYMAFQFILLPFFLQWGNDALGGLLNAGELNTLYFLLNFIGVIWIFHSYLSKNLAAAQKHPLVLVQTGILALAGYFASAYGISVVIGLILPEYSNYNDAALVSMGQENYFLLAVGTVVLVPPVEECFFRGLLFRKLWGKTRAGAYILSALAFALIHVVGYLGVYTPLELGLAMLQYLPAGLWLGWAYRKCGHIFGPILTHAAVNAISVAQLF